MGITVDDRFHPDLTAAVRRLVEHFQPDRIYLFGSQARGDAGTDSDYDILVVVPNTQESGFRAAQRAYGVLWGLSVPLEIVILTHSEFTRDAPFNASLPGAAIREGALLYAA